MKATGIVRRIDNLGRVVIPKEIRKTLRIKEGDALEIFTDKDGEVILKKYSPIEEMGEYARKYGEALYQAAGHSVLITDAEQVIAASGMGKKEAINRNLTTKFESLIDERQTKSVTNGGREFVDIYQEMTIALEGYVVSPVIYEGNVIGSIVITQREGERKIGEVEMKLAQIGSYYLAHQME